MAHFKKKHGERLTTTLHYTTWSIRSIICIFCTNCVRLMSEDDETFRIEVMCGALS